MIHSGGSISGYRPSGMNMWDTWFIEHGGTAHMYHLQRKRLGSNRTDLEADSVGHATSTDLINWEEQEPALPPNPIDKCDDLQPWTGCVVENEGTFYMFYTMRGSKEGGRCNRIGLALSKDLFHWERFQGNPVITPDPRWYISNDKPHPNGRVDCRDLVVIPDQENGGWLGFYAAMIHGEELSESGVIATVRSRDLLHWEHLPPAFAPGKYCVVEVPDVFHLDGRWYMTYLAGNAYGNRGLFSDPYAVRGTNYAVSDRPEGPYRELAGDNVLICGDQASGYSCRSVEFAGERYAFYTQPTTGGDTLSPPMRVCTEDNGTLRLKWSPRSSAFRKETLLSANSIQSIKGLPFCSSRWFRPNGRWHIDGIRTIGECRTGWQVADICSSGHHVEIEALISVQEAKAVGLALRSDISSAACNSNDLFFIVEKDNGVVRAARPQLFSDPFVRQWNFPEKDLYKIRLCARPPWYDFYVEEDLVLQFNLDIEKTGNPGIGLFIDRGRTEVDGLTVYGL